MNSVSAHTVPVSMLKQIARSGHVYALPRSFGALVKAGGAFNPKLIGVNKASTITAFCSKHDTSLFAPIENGDLQPCVEHAFLLSFRAVAYELFAKEAAVLSDSDRRDMDKGLPYVMQVVMQQTNSDMTTGFQTALRDLQYAKDELDQMWRSKDFSGIEFGVFSFKAVPDVMCCTCGTPSFDFHGKPLQDLGKLDVRMQGFSLSILGARDLGCAFFAWTKANATVSRRFLHSLIANGKAAVSHAIMRYVLEKCENVYLRPEWWEGLSKDTHGFLVDRLRDAADLNTDIRPDALIDDGLRLVDFSRF